MPKKRKPAGGGQKTEEKDNTSSGHAKSNATLVAMAIQAFENKLSTKNVTVADFLRLLQIQKEMDGDELKEIRITWVEPNDTEPSSKT